MTPSMKTNDSVVGGNSGMQDYCEVCVEQQSMRIWITFTQFFVAWMSGNFKLYQKSLVVTGNVSCFFQLTTFLPGNCSRKHISSHIILSKQIFGSQQTENNHTAWACLEYYQPQPLTRWPASSCKAVSKMKTGMVCRREGQAFGQIRWQDHPLMREVQAIPAVRLVWTTDLVLTYTLFLQR